LAEGIAQAIEQMPRKHKALSSNPSITKKQKKKRKSNEIEAVIVSQQ
jgi:hypothetical protein